MGRVLDIPRISFDDEPRVGDHYCCAGKLVAVSGMTTIKDLITIAVWMTVMTAFACWVWSLTG